MIILYTDHISLLQHPDSAEGKRLLKRLGESTDQEIVTTVITVEEQMRGWLQVIARYRDLRQQGTYYHKLVDFIRFFSKWKILPLQESAVQVFQTLRAGKVRIATTDLKIAAIALSCAAILLSRNSQDFRLVPGLHVEDWTAV
jgi:tRNA(fMet)-specific endonuclease VapC